MKLYTKKGIAFEIDDDDSFAVSMYSWHVGSRGYPVTKIGKRPHQRSTELHQFLLGLAPEGFCWDHINRDRLDNRRSNLRLVTPVVNARNASLSVRNTSGTRGVSWHKREGRWMAKLGQRIGGRERTIYLGLFAAKDDAIAARLAAEEALWSMEERDERARPTSQ